MFFLKKRLGLGSNVTEYIPAKVLLPGFNNSGIQKLSCGNRHVILLFSDGTCYGWGNNFNAQLSYDYLQEDYKKNLVLSQRYYCYYIIIYMLYGICVHVMYFIIYTNNNCKISTCTPKKDKILTLHYVYNTS